MTIVEFEIPGLRTTTGQNAREHHQERARRVKSERSRVGLALLAAVHWKVRLDLKVRLGRGERLRLALTRVSPARGKVADGDNVSGGLKAVRDAVAEWLGVDDGDARLGWSTAGAVGPWAVRIRIEAGP